MQDYDEDEDGAPRHDRRHDDGRLFRWRGDIGPGTLLTMVVSLAVAVGGIYAVRADYDNAIRSLSSKQERADVVVENLGVRLTADQQTQSAFQTETRVTISDMQKVISEVRVEIARISSTAAVRQR